jgi:anhydro-N-acetylmuramic acid kinase
MIAIGLMSGTSCDGIDAAMIETDGLSVFKSIAECHLPYDTNFQKKLLQLMDKQQNWLEIEVELTKYHADIVKQLLAMTALKPQVIGFHGQTIFHAPHQGICWQIGNPHILAQLTGIDVISDFRRRDIAAGGHGAPLVPIFHKALMKDHELPVAIVNIGGVANLTYIGKDNILIGCDLGPGNALINDAMMKYYNRPYDEDGRVAKSGLVDEEFVAYVMSDPFFDKAYPKSLDRNHFKNYKLPSQIIRPEDKIATLTAITVAGISRGLTEEILGHRSPQEVYLCGGGAKNKAIAQQLGESKILPNSEYIEAQAFAYIAVRYLKNLPSSFPSTTGVNQAILSGVLFRP